MGEKPKHVSYGCCAAGVPGSKKGVSGVRFSLAPMSDGYAEQILGAIRKVDLSKLWSKSDATSTVYRGTAEAVLDGLRACFIYAYREGVHMSLDATLTKGCPGDVDADYTLEFEEPRVNYPKLAAFHFPVAGRFAVYPLGTDSYMSLIADTVNAGIDRGVVSGSGHYATFLQGDVHAVFDYLSDIFLSLSARVSHLVIEIALACNFPEEN